MVSALWRSFPTSIRFGLAVAASGVVADLVHHLFTHELHALEPLHIDVIGHALTLAGMVIALWGVVHAAVDSRRRAREKGGRDAARSSAAASR
jgi:drug/metabolite transporter superfamily protein YnfA